MLHKSFKPAKCKTALNLAKSRIKLMKNRKDIQLKQLKREVAQLLESKQDQTARIRVEHVLREEKMMAAYEMIEIYCELVVARLPIIESQKSCPLDLKEAIASLIFAAPRCGDITELQDVRKHFTAKYGKDFAAAAVEIRPNCGVSRTLVEKLSVNAPDGPTKVKILTAIAEEHNIQWEPNWFKDEIPVPSVDIPNVEAHTVEGNKIQMQPLNFEIADDFEEKHAHDAARPGTSFQSHSQTSNDLDPPISTSRLDSRLSESSSEKMVFSQSSGTPESAFSAERKKWNMEFKDATAAAQAAAESAELASFAARAAAELSLRGNVMSESSSIPSHSSVPDHSEEKRQSTGSGQQHGHVPKNSISGSINQSSPRMKNQGVNRPENMTHGGDSTSFNKDYAQFKEQYERENQDLSKRESDIGHAKDSDYSPVASKTEPTIFSSSNFDEYELESSENPFHEEPVEWKNQHSSFVSQSCDFGDDYGVFAKLNYDKYEDDSGGSSLGNFSRNIGGHEDWHVRGAYSYGGEDKIFNDEREGYRVSGVEDSKDYKRESRVLESDVKHGFDSDKDIFVGMDHGTSGKDNDEKNIHTDDKVVFDETDSDDNDTYVLNSTEEHHISSPSKVTHKVSSFNQDNPHYEPDLSKSFRSSSLYSKLLEPMPMDFDDSDGASSGNEKEQQREKADPGVDSYDNEKSDADHHLEFMRSSDVGKGNAGSVKSTKYMEENVNRYSSSEFEEVTQAEPEGGLALNLGSLPIGRRNRAQWRIPRDGLAYAPSDTFDSSENPAFESSSHKQEPSKMSGVYNHSDSPSHKQKPSNMSGVYTHFDSPSNYTESKSGSKDSDSGERPYGVVSHVPVRRTSPRDPTGYFVSDDSEPEDDPKPVTSRNFVSAKLSRRTKASSPRSKTVQSSSSYTTKVSSSRNNNQSSPDDDATNVHQSLATKVSKDDTSSYSPVAVNSTAPRSSNVLEASSSIDKAPSKENSAKMPSHVHPKLPDFETFTAHLQSLRKNRQ